MRPRTLLTPIHRALPLSLPSMASLSEHFQAVTTEKTKVSFLKMSYDQLANQRIAFGEATGAEIQGCSRGSKVHSLVCQEVREFPKVCSSDVHPLHSDLHGATRDDTGIRPSVKTIDTGTQSLSPRQHIPKSQETKVPTAGRTRKWNPSRGACSTKRRQP